LEAKVIADDYNRLDKDKKLLITDIRVILTTDSDSYTHQDTFLIGEVLWIAVSTKKKRGFLI